MANRKLSEVGTTDSLDSIFVKIGNAVKQITKAKAKTDLGIAKLETDVSSINSNLENITFNLLKSEYEGAVSLSANTWTKISSVSINTFKNKINLVTTSVVNATNNECTIELAIGSDTAIRIYMGMAKVQGWKSAKFTTTMCQSYDEGEWLWVRSSGTSISYPHIENIFIEIPKK